MKRWLILFLCFSIAGCMDHEKQTDKDYRVKLITLDPGHFHAALVQKSMYPDIDPVVHVYAPAGPDVEDHLLKIEAYNTAQVNPTHWDEQVYAAGGFFEKMLSEKKGNVVVIAGNNQHKTQYIQQSINAGFNVLADKPMAIDRANFELLQEAFKTAEIKKLLLYDIMTERFEITTILQKQLSLMPGVFGTLQKGTIANPAVEQESVHFFYKYVSGKVLKRPDWFFDVASQGEGITDVATHLVDLVQWMCFPEQAIDYKKDIEIDGAKHWPTDLTINQFETLTGASDFPGFLKKYQLNDSTISVLANGEINYTLRGIHTRVTVKWDYQSTGGSGDTHNAIMRGTKASLVIKQGAAESYKPVLYIEPTQDYKQYYAQLQESMKVIQSKYPGVTLKKIGAGWQVAIPQKYDDGHEAHFAQVTTNFLEYLKKGNMPPWETPNMLAKYYTTITASEKAKNTK
jgi:predicted dehydrogenase